MADRQHKHKHQQKRKAENCKSKHRNNNIMPDVQLSKSLSWVLRHSAPSLGLKLSSDGFVPVEHILTLNHARFRKGNGQTKYSVEDVIRVVENNDKKRFRLEYKDNDDICTKRNNTANASKLSSSLDQNTTSINNTAIVKGEDDETHNNKVLCIRANQGHSLKGLKTDQLLQQLTCEELSNPNLSIIHGTTHKAWRDHIKHKGLNRMKRNHIHFATGLPPPKDPSSSSAKKYNDAQPISGIRASSEIYIYINGSKCATDGIKVYKSDNGVILTAGVNEDGTLPLTYVEKVVNATTGSVLWKQNMDINESSDK